MRWPVMVPAAVLLVLVGVLGYGLTRSPSVLPSALIDKPAPDFNLPTLDRPGARMTAAALKGQVSLVNVWASWCVACRSENSVIAQVSQRTGVPVVGISYKDKRASAKRWLDRFGDPFAVVALDRSGRTGIDWGVSGVPETFVVDANGVIRYKVVGPISHKEMVEQLIPELRKLKGAS